MSKKTLLTLLGIFVILGIAASYSWWGQYVSFYKKSLSDAELNFSGFTESATDKISIISGDGGEITIVKENGAWKVNGFVADQKEVENFFDTLVNLTIGSLVSRNSANHENFEVTQDSGIILTLTRGNTETIFVIGKRSAAFNSFYTRMKESDNVYEVSGNLRDKISRSVAAWRDKTVVNIPKESIQRVEVNSQAALLVMTKNEEGWNAQKASKRATLNEATADRLLAAFNPLEASGFLSEGEQKEFEKAKDKTIIRVFGDSDKNIATINLFKKDNDWWGQLEEKTIFYKIPSYKLSNIPLKDEDIFVTK